VKLLGPSLLVRCILGKKRGASGPKGAPLTCPWAISMSLSRRHPSSLSTYLRAAASEACGVGGHVGMWAP
jgi:hypothetical protein